MKTHRFASHTPAEQRRLSNLGHIVEGLLLATVGVLALLSDLGMTWAALAWPILLLSAGVLLLILIYPRHPPSDWSAIWHDPQQQQHTIMAVAIALAGVIELGGFRFAWPLAAIIIGTLFLTHKQHGGGHAVVRAVLIHRVLGVTVIAAGLFRAVAVAASASLLTWLWPLALLVAAVQLIIYREPEGAFEAEDGHPNHHQSS